MKKGFIGVLTAGVMVLGIAAAGAIFSLKIIEPGTVGAVYSPGSGVSDQVLTQGWQFTAPWNKVKIYSTATNTLFMSADEREGSEFPESFDVTTKDGKMNVDFEMSYSFDSEKVPDIYVKYGGKNGQEIIDTIIKGKVKTLSNEVTTQFTTLEAHMTKKAGVNAMLTKHLREQLAVFGVNVESANFTRTTVDKAVEAAITERSKASQQLEAEKQLAEKARVQAERIKIEAQAKADANAIITKSLSEEILKDKAINKWNGVVPQVTGGNAIVDIKGNK